VLDLLALALLPGGQHRLAAVLLQQNGTVLHHPEIAGPHFASVQHGERQPVRERRPQLFHEVERQARPAGPQAVQEASRGVQAHAFQGAAAVMHEQGVEEGEQRIGHIHRRPPAAAAEGERGIGDAQRMGEDAEIQRRRLAFLAAQPVQIGLV
jgi:hypothetical protein